MIELVLTSALAVMLVFLILGGLWATVYAGSDSPELATTVVIVFIILTAVVTSVRYHTEHPAAAPVEAHE